MCNDEIAYREYSDFERDMVGAGQSHWAESISELTSKYSLILSRLTFSFVEFRKPRAVIPELQIPEGEPLLPDSNADVQEVHVATQYLRGPPGLRWEHLPEEPAWAQLIPDGMNQETRNFMNNEKGRSKHLYFILLLRLYKQIICSMLPTTLAPRPTEDLSSIPLLLSPISAKDKFKTLPKRSRPF